MSVDATTAGETDDISVRLKPFILAPNNEETVEKYDDLLSSLEERYPPEIIEKHLEWFTEAMTHRVLVRNWGLPSDLEFLAKPREEWTEEEKRYVLCLSGAQTQTERVIYARKVVIYEIIRANMDDGVETLENAARLVVHYLPPNESFRISILQKYEDYIWDTIEDREVQELVDVHRYEVPTHILEVSAQIGLIFRKNYLTFYKGGSFAD